MHIPYIIIFLFFMDFFAIFYQFISIMLTKGLVHSVGLLTERSIILVAFTMHSAGTGIFLNVKIMI